MTINRPRPRIVAGRARLSERAAEPQPSGARVCNPQQLGSTRCLRPSRTGSSCLAAAGYKPALRAVKTLALRGQYERTSP